MKILVTGMNVERAAQRVKELAIKNNIETDIQVYEGFPEEIDNDFDIVIFLYEDPKVIPKGLERIEKKMIFCGRAGIGEVVTEISLRMYNRILSKKLET